MYVYIYIYIWVNSNISLTWNKAMAGDDSPKINHNFQFGRTVRSLFHLPRLERFYMNQTIHDLINLHDFGIFHYSPSNSLGARDFPWNKLTKPSSYRVSPQKTSVFSEKWGICELKKNNRHPPWKMDPLGPERWNPRPNQGFKGSLPRLRNGRHNQATIHAGERRYPPVN